MKTNERLKFHESAKQVSQINSTQGILCSGCIYPAVKKKKDVKKKKAITVFVLTF